MKGASFFSSVFRASALWAFTACYWGYQILRHAICLKRIDPDHAPSIIQGWGKGMLRLARIRVELDNPCPYLNQPSPRLVVCNHPSTLDLLWGSLICPPRPFSIGKRELIFIPVINLVWWMLGFRLIDRKNRSRAIASLQDVPRWVRERSLSLIMAPEGTRSHDGSIGPFKRGPFHIAIEAQLPIYPIVASGAYELMPRTAWFPKTGTIRVRFLEPISTVGLGENDVARLSDSCQAAMSAELAKMQQSRPQLV